MAESGGGEDRSGEDLTEEASPHRIEEMRKRGQVAQSKELTGLIALLATGVATYAMAPSLGGQLAEFMREVFRTDLSARADLVGTHVLADTWMRAVHIGAAVGLPIAVAGFILGVIGSYAQIGNIFTLETLTPDFGKIDPIAGFKRLVSVRHLVDGVRMMLKMSVVVAVAYGLVKSQVIGAGAHALNDPAELFSAYGGAAKGIFMALCGVLLLFSAIDYGMQRFEYSKQTRMTKAEAKQEFKEREGDPQIKARIRAVQREMARKRMMQAVKKADVIVTNPTHIAIALVYDKDKMAAPRVVAKGADFLAQRIKKIAAEAGVPLVENVPLARTLYKTVKVGQSVPRALYQAVAEVLAYVYRLKNRGL